MPAEARRQLHIEEVLRRPPRALDAEARFLVVRVDHGDDLRVRNSLPDRQIERLRALSGLRRRERIDQRDPLRRGDLHQRQQRAVGALRDELRVQREDPAAVNRVDQVAHLPRLGERLG